MTSLGKAYIQAVVETKGFAPDLARGFNAAIPQVRTMAAGVGAEAGQALSDATVKGVSGTGEAAGESISSGAQDSLGKAKPGFDRAGEELGDTVATGAERSSGRVRSAFGRLASAAKTALIGLSTAVAAGVVTMTGFGLKSAAALEQTQVAFHSLLGGVEQGNKVFAELQEFSAATPFQFPEVAEAAQRFLAFSNAAGLSKDQLQDFLTTVGDVASVTGAGSAGLASVNLALGQISSTGKVTIGDLTQLSNALPGFSGAAAIASATGKTTAEVMEQISKGELDAATGIAALLEGMKQFPGAAGAMEKQSQTLLGVFSTFKDTLQQDLVAGFAPAIPEIKEELLKLTPIMSEAFGQLAPVLGQALSAVMPLIGQLIGALVPIIAPIVEGLAAGLAAIGPTLAPLGQALGLIATALAPLLELAGGLISALAQGLTPVIAALAPLIEGLAGGLLKALAPLMPIIVQIGTTLGAVLLPVAELLGELFAQLGPVIGELVAELGAALMPLFEALGPVVVELASALLPLIPAIVGIVKALVPLIPALVPLIELLAQLLVMVVQVSAPMLELVALLVEFLAAEAIAPLIGLIADALTWLLSPLSDVAKWLGKVNEWFGKIDWGSVGKDIGAAFTSAWEAVASFFADLWDWYTSIPGRIRELLAALPGVLWKAFTAAFDRALAAIGAGIALMLFTVTQLPGLILDVLRWLPGRLADFWSGLWDGAVRMARAGVLNTVSWFLSLRSRALDAVADLGRRIVSGFSGMWSRARSAVSSGISRVISLIRNAPRSIGNLGSLFASAGRRLISSFMGGFRAAGSYLSGVAGDITRALKSQLNRIIRKINSGIASIDRFLPGNLGRIPLLAHGGIFDKATLGVVGEAGREVVLPVTRPRRAAELIRESGLGDMFGGGARQVIVNARLYLGTRDITDLVRVEVDDVLGGTADEIAFGTR